MGAVNLPVGSASGQAASHCLDLLVLERGSWRVGIAATKELRKRALEEPGASQYYLGGFPCRSFFGTLPPSPKYPRVFGTLPPNTLGYLGGGARTNYAVESRVISGRVPISLI